MQNPAHNELTAALRGCVGGVLWAAFFGVFVNAFQLTVPLYMLQIFDRVIVSHSIDTLVMLTLLAIVCLVFLACIDVVRHQVFIVLGERLALRLARPTLQASVTSALRAPSSQSGQGIRDLHELRQFVTSGPVALPFDALFSPLFLLVLFLLHPAYGAVALAAALVLLALSVVMEFVVRRPSQGANEAAYNAYAEVGNAIRHAEAIEAMGMLGPVAHRWYNRHSAALRSVAARNFSMRTVVAVSRAVRMAVQIIMLATGAWLVINRQVSPGTIVAATIIMSRVLFPFEQLVDGWRHWVQAAGAYRRLQALLRPGDAPRQETPMTASQGRLVVEKLGFVPPAADHAVLRGVSFTLEPGEILGIVGPSGAGKSTLARLLVGVWPPTSGNIFLDGHSTYSWERESFGRAVGYLPQFATLLDGTVGENIARMGNGRSAEMIAAARRVGAHEMIGRLPLGYETRVGDGGFSLSGGQRQRIALARAFYGKPRLIVLDEPNGHLDAEGEKAMLAAVETARADGAAVVIIAHRPSVVAVADRILTLEEGVAKSVEPQQISHRPAHNKALGGAVVAQLPVIRRAGAS